MKNVATMVRLLRTFLEVVQHPRKDLLQNMIDLLQAGCGFNLGLKEYCVGKDTEARVREDAQQKVLKKLVKDRKATQNFMKDVQAALAAAQPTDALPDKLSDITNPGDMPLMLDLMMTWELDSESIVDAVELIAANNIEHSKKLQCQLQKVCDPYWKQEETWHLDLPNQDDLKEVLKKGASKVPQRVGMCNK